MRPAKALLLVTALCCFAVGAYAFTDAPTVRGHQCGSITDSRDAASISRGITPSGDVAKDDFAVQSVIDDCSHQLGLRQLITALSTIGAVGSLVFAVRSRPRRPEFRGDPIV